MNITHTRSAHRRTGRRWKHLAAAAVALTVGGLAISADARADSPTSSCIEEFYGGNPGTEISFFAGPFFRDFNPGSGWHDNGDPLVPGRCNPTWTD